MPKIEVNTNFRVNPEAEQFFKKGEIESEANMDKLYAMIKSDGGVGVRAKDAKNEEFHADPKDLRNWSFIGEDSLKM